MGRFIAVAVLVVVFGCEEKSGPRHDPDGPPTEEERARARARLPFSREIEELTAMLAEADRKIAAGSGDASELAKLRAAVEAKLVAAKALQKKCLENPLDDACQTKK